MNTETAIVSSTEGRALAPVDAMREAMSILEYGLTDTSKRQYQHTFTLWAAWCWDNGAAAHDLSAKNVMAFLEAGDLARRTKQARLSHLRRLAQTLHTGDVSNDRFKQNYEQLRLLKLPKDSSAGQPRARHAFGQDEIYSALDHWPKSTALGKRNRALLAVLFYTGLRRAEAARLKWSDFDMTAGLLTVEGGKGRAQDESDAIPVPGFDRLKKHLLAWRREIPMHEYIFVAVNKADRVGADKPITTETIRRVCQAAGLPDFKPHDARRTLATSLINAGTPIPDVQFIMRHKNPQTTLGYAVIKNATDVQGRIKLNY